MGSKILARGLLSSALVGLIAAACGSPTSNDSTGNASGGTAAQEAAREMGIDLSKCPTDITKPLTGTIKVGTTIGLTGPAAASFTFAGTGERAAIDGLNSTSDLPVSFSLTQVDDQFAPDKALAGGQRLIQSDKVDFLDGIIGTADIAAIRTVAQQNCVPLLAANGSGVSANFVSEFPFTTIWSLPSYIDVKVWIEKIKEEFPNGAKVATYTANTDTGKDYLDAIKEQIEGSGMEIVSSTTVEAADAGVPSSQVTTMKASGANVLMAAPSPSGQCSSVVKEVANQGWKPDAFFVTSQCSTLQLFAPAGEAAQDVLCNIYLNDPAASSASADAGLQEIVAAINKFAPGQPVTGASIAGWSAMEVLYRAAEQAKKSPLGLSRLGILYAATHINYHSSTMLPGIDYSLNYPEDQVALEAAQLSSFDSSSNQWKAVKVYDFDGQTTGTASG